jgi:energy-coupling factor transporter ATP-binding protein EcfA2
MIQRQSAVLTALGRIEGCKQDLRQLSTELALAPLWRPGISLLRQCEEALRMIEDISARFDRKLVVTIVGPSGSGKSTLLNALAGVDDLSEVGHQRPTTAQLIVFAEDEEGLEQLRTGLNRTDIDIRSAPGAVLLKNVILIDTPDTDSRANHLHIPILRQTIALSDILICVFDAENPKRRDHVDFLAPLIRLFNGESLVVVLNKCDRQQEQELKDHIVPDFLNHLQGAWEIPPAHTFCISARSNLSNPDWDDIAGPKHGFDQFDDLRQLVLDTFNRAGYVVDRRLQNVRALHGHVFNQVQAELERSKTDLETADQKIREAERVALLEAVAGMQTEDSHQILSVNVLLYQRLSQRWTGPVGWLIAVWARLMLFGSGVVALLRFGRPLRQIIGLFSALRHFKDTQAVSDEQQDGRRVDAALTHYRLAFMQRWPQIAETLVKGGFDGAVRNLDDALSHADQFSDRLSELWVTTLDREIDRCARIFSGFFLQLLFNLPGLAVLGYAGWITLRQFFSGAYLSTGFFLHAFLALAIVFMLSFFVFQTLVRLIAGSERITRRALASLKNRVQGMDIPAVNPIRTQLQRVLALAVAAAVSEGPAQGQDVDGAVS